MHIFIGIFCRKKSYPQKKKKRPWLGRMKRSYELADAMRNNGIIGDLSLTSINFVALHRPTQCPVRFGFGSKSQAFGQQLPAETWDDTPKQQLGVRHGVK